MTLQRRGEYWYGESTADIRALMASHAAPVDPIEIVQDVVCDCGGSVFSVQIDDDYLEAAWICRGCDAQYLFHTRPGTGYFEGNPEADTEGCFCPCTERGGSYFELAVGVSLCDDSEDVDWVFIACRCVACGITGYLAEWHRIEIPYSELFAHMSNKQDV